MKDIAGNGGKENQSENHKILASHSRQLEYWDVIMCGKGVEQDID